MVKKKQTKCNVNLPTVSICTPTGNRESLFKNIIMCVEEQDYPKDLIQWVIVDDGDIPIKHYIDHLDYVTYIHLKDKISIGKKRNITHTHCTGDIIVYMDDDDYYPPKRVSNAVHVLNRYKRSGVMIAGSSILHIYDTATDDIYEFGPYGKNHSTAGAFAFMKELLRYTAYDDEALYGEERFFLKNYSIPMIQLDPIKTILCMSHNSNTYDKRPMFINKSPTKLKLNNFKSKKSKWDISLFAKDKK